MIKIVPYLMIRNEEFYISMALESVIERAYGIYILDTGSTDKTLEIVKQFQDKYPKKRIVLEEKFFGGSVKWETPEGREKIDDIVPKNGFREIMARDYAYKRTLQEFPDLDWFVLIDGDEAINNDFFDEVEWAHSMGAWVLGHSTILPSSTTTMWQTGNATDYRPLRDGIRHIDLKLFDPHPRAFTPQSADDTKLFHRHLKFHKMAVSDKHIHFHLHYAVGPKAIYSWLLDWKYAENSVPELLGIPYNRWDDQKAYEEKFPEWFLNGKFRPKKDVLARILNNSTPLTQPLPPCVVAKWNEWGDWSL
jgi:glycosyltransferase involved in cell wall biosynthesis